MPDIGGFALTVDQHAVEHAVDDVAAQCALVPVITAGHRARDLRRGAKLGTPSIEDETSSKSSGHVYEISRDEKARTDE